MNNWVRIYLFLTVISISARANDKKKDSLSIAPIVGPRKEMAAKKLNLDALSIRKTFDGSSKDEQKPATINWVYDRENSYHYFTADLGIKFAEINLFPRQTFAIQLLPKAEFHKDGTDDQENKKDNLNAGFNLEVLPYAIGSHLLVPFAIGSAEYKIDFLKNAWILPIKAFISAKGNKTGTPGSNINDQAGNLVFRYYPYLGYERYEKTSGNSSISSFLANRLFFELYPIPTPTNKFQLTFDYAYRISIKDNLYEYGNMCWLTISINFYFDAKQRFGIGTEYSYGNDPTGEFIKTNKFVTGLKFKI